MTDAADRLHMDSIQAAQALIEGEFAEAARHARRANWRWQRLPADEQNSYVESEVVDTAAPPIGEGDDEERAFLLWFGYRCGLSAHDVRRDSEAADEAYAAKQAADRLAAERSAAAAESTQATLFAPAVETSYRQSAPKARIKD